MDDYQEKLRLAKKALYTYIYNPQYFNSPDPRMELVESVYKDLKKLKEE